MSSIQKVEVVVPTPPTKRALGIILNSLFGLALRTLLVYWFFSSWFPTLGLTYWGLVLPVYIARFLFSSSQARVIPTKYLRRIRRFNWTDDTETEELEEIAR